MDKNNINKRSNFFKKEGFYVILFVCLCVVATVAAVTTKNNKKIKNTPIPQASITDQKSTIDVAEEPSVDYQNALQVKNAANAAKADVTVPKNGSKDVAAVADTNYVKPVNGTIARPYSEEPVYWDSTSSYRPNLGIDIKANLGDSVVAVLDGKVEQVNNATEGGVQIVINHQNGIKTVYSNLDTKVKVTQGQTIKKNTVIGTIGNTTLNSAYEKYGSHLHFSVLKGTQYVDPLKYVKY